MLLLLLVVSFTGQEQVILLSQPAAPLHEVLTHPSDSPRTSLDRTCSCGPFTLRSGNP